MSEIRTKVDTEYEILIIDDNSDQETKDYLRQQEDLTTYSFTYNIGVNQAWSLGYSKAKYPNVLIINNDIIFKKGLVEELEDGLDKDIDIVGPLSTEGPRPYQLPIFEKSNNICGHCFMIKKGLSCFPIPQQLDLRFGDDWIYHMVGKDRIKIIESSLVHHYGSKTIKDKVYNPRVKNDIIERQKICKEKGRIDDRVLTNL